MRYEVTEIAGPYIAGRRVRRGDILDVDPATVAYEIDQGWLVSASEAVAAGDAPDGSANPDGAPASPQRRR